MTWIIVGAVFIFMIALLFVFMTSSGKKVTREEFLEKLAKETEGKISPMPELPNSLRIDFDFEGRHFWYEDIEGGGFTQNIYKGILKTKANTDLTLTFSRKDRNKILGEMQMMSKLSDATVNKHIKVFVPKEFVAFEISTQDPYKTNMFFDDKKVRAILLKYRMNDRQGDAYMPISIQEGVVCLEFSPDNRLNLNRDLLLEKTHLMETFVDDLTVLAKFFQQ